jgi:UDP-2,3-diacylglucosamine pyrophosphatase LpxH
MKYSKWLARLGGHGYDLLIVLNRFVNHVLEKLGRDKISLSKRIKDGVKTAVSFISDFEQIAADLAIERGYDYVICGHIHQPVIKTMTSSSPPAPGQEARTVTYLNSGDWIENLTALEYHLGQWTLHRYAARPDEIRENAPFASEEPPMTTIPNAVPHPFLEEIFSLATVSASTRLGTP